MVSKKKIQAHTSTEDQYARRLYEFAHAAFQAVEPLPVPPKILRCGFCKGCIQVQVTTSGIFGITTHFLVAFKALRRECLCPCACLRPMPLSSGVG